MSSVVTKPSATPLPTEWHADSFAGPVAADPDLPTVIRIGRATDNEVVVDDLLTALRHAELRDVGEGRLELVDLGSQNGTFLNGRRIKRAQVQNLDVISIGHHLYRLVDGQLQAYVDDGLVVFRATGLCVRIPGGATLVDRVSFSLQERALLAVVGPSGAGKSSLLNALTGFRPADEGSALYAGRDLYADYEELRVRIGFVPQKDIVHGALTVRQALDYTGRLRFANDVTEAERNARIEEVMRELGLEHRADTVIDGLSGGQRRRVSVGLELISKPSLLFLDEPTSGLDPGYERSVMELLRQLADGGRTVVVVTHSVQSLRLCDRVLYLAPGGKPAYFGPPQLASAYFGCEDEQEVFRHLSADDTRDWAGDFSRHPYHAEYVDLEVESIPAAQQGPPPGALPKARGWLAQLNTLTRRYLRVLTGDRRTALLLLAQPPVLGILLLVALPAHELASPADGSIRLVSRAGLVLLVTMLAATWLGASNAVREIVREDALMRRERATGVTVSAYVTSKALVLGALTTLQALVFVPIALARQGGPDAGSLLPAPLPELMLAGVLAGLAGMSLGLLISAVSRSVDRAMTVLPIVLIFQMLLAMGGLFPDIVDKPVLKQASYLAGTKWAFDTSASTVDLDRLQTIDKLARAVPQVRPSDPTPILAALGKVQSSERLWRHDASTWLLDAGALVALTLAGLLGSVFVLFRRGIVE